MFKETLPTDIYLAQGTHPNGPNILILGGTHGDELPGIEVVKKLLNILGLNSENSVVERTDLIGNIFIGFGNPEAIKIKQRGTGSGPDLNRSFSVGLEKPSTGEDSLDLQRARELASLMRNIDILLDIHSTSNPSEPFVCSSNSGPMHREIASLIDVKYFITDPDNVLAKDFGLPNTGTTDYFVNTNGGGDWSIKRFGEKTGTAICFESGQEKDLTQVPRVLNTVLKILSHIGSTTEEFPIQPTEKDTRFEQQEYKLAISVHAKDNDFRYIQGMDKPFQRIKTGQLIGTYANGKEELAPTDGLYVFPKSEEKIEMGKNLYFIAT